MRNRDCGLCKQAFAPAFAGQRFCSVDCRFWSKVDRLGDGDCWNWMGSKTAGYGTFSMNGAPRLAHRVSFTMAHGDIPSEALVLHSCDNRACCNPSHLRAGSAKDNSEDMVQRGRHWTQNGGAGIEEKEREKLSDLGSSKKVSPDDVIRIRDAYARGGLSFVRLAEVFNLSSSAIGNIASGKSHAEAGGPIVARGRKRLTPMQRHVVRHMRMSGEHLDTIADEVGAAVSSIQRYCRRHGIAPVR